MGLTGYSTVPRMRRKPATTSVRIRGEQWIQDIPRPRQGHETRWRRDCEATCSRSRASWLLAAVLELLSLFTARPTLGWLAVRRPSLLIPERPITHNSHAVETRMGVRAWASASPLSFAAAWPLRTKSGQRQHFHRQQRMHQKHSARCDALAWSRARSIENFEVECGSAGTITVECVILFLPCPLSYYSVSAQTLGCRPAVWELGSGFVT